MIYIFVSFLIVAFGQPAWVPGFGLLAAAVGFALFWRGMLFFPRQLDRFLLSSIWFAAVQGVQLSWMTTMDYMGPFIIAVYLFLILGMGAQFGLLSFFFRKPICWSSAFAIAGAWVMLEYSRLFFLCGFSWNVSGLALAGSSLALQTASITGIFGLSFWVILVNLAALRAMIEKSLKKIAIWGAMAVFPYLFGCAHQFWVESTFPVSRHLNVALIQTALFPEQKEWLPENPSSFIRPLDQWERIFDVLNGEKPLDLMVLPEAALPLGAHQMGYDLKKVKEYFKDEVLPPLKSPFAIFSRGRWKVNNAFILQALANHYKTHIIVGLDDRDDKGSYNAAFHFYPNDKLPERYEKRVLVPIGEYIPFTNCHKFSRFIANQFHIYSSFVAGTKAKVFDAPLPTGISICLEETFGGLTRELRLNGAELLVNLTNDVWFPRSKLPQQHFDHGRIRAIENGMPILRACNTGITGCIDSFGRPLAQLPISEEKTGSLYFTLKVRSYPTLYTLWGDWAILGISIVFLISYFLKKVA